MWVIFVLVLVGCPGAPPIEESAVGDKAGQSFEWKLVTTWPKNLPAIGTAPERLAVMVEEMSAGRFKIKVYVWVVDVSKSIRVES